MSEDNKVLLHCCCGPCAIYPYKRLIEMGYQPICYFYNPNIHPYTEFLRRIEAMKVFAYETGAELIVDGEYGLDKFMRLAYGSPDRCVACYEMRARQTAAFSRERGISQFTSTLLYSKYQQHEKIVEAFRTAAAEHGLELMYVDFREGWKEGIRESRQMGLYRQQYCGCIFSEQERYLQDK